MVSSVRSGFGLFHVISVVTGGFHFLWWFWVVFTVFGGFGWYSMC